MELDVLVLNTSVVDLRRPDFDFVDSLVGKGGLAKCRTEDMPTYSQDLIRMWIAQGNAKAGGQGNTAPLMAKAGLKVGVGAYLGKGNYDGLDAQGRFFYDTSKACGIDVTALITHPTLPTGTTFIHERSGDERGGIAYFPNANNDFDFDVFKVHVKRLHPKIVYYMYSGLSDKGDANEGQDLADFIDWCRKKDIVTIADSHTLTGNPQKIITEGTPVTEYLLLKPLLSKVDILFTSSDEAKIIANTLDGLPKFDKKRTNASYLREYIFALTRRYVPYDGKTKLLGVTVSDGAYFRAYLPTSQPLGIRKVNSRFMDGATVDLVGAGDSFRAGLLTYIANNLDAFKSGKMNFYEAVQMANLFASSYIKAPLGDRYIHIKPYKQMLEVVRCPASFSSLLRA